MNIPGEFYYSETQSSIEYSRTPTGALEINELIAGNACWIPATLPRIQKPKSLVLADWTAKAWSSDKIECVIKSLAYLMNQGFSFYVWRDGHVFSMTRQDLSKLSSPDVRYEMTLAAADVVRDVAVKEQKLSFDQVHVMDDYWLDCILSDNNVPGPRVLRVSDTTKLSDEALDDVIEVLTKATPPLTLMLHDEFSLKSNEKAHQLKQKQTLAHIDYEVSYHKADAFRLSIEDMLEAVTLDGMPKLEVLSLSKKKLPKDHLEALIEACPDLQSLNLSDFTNLDQDILFKYGLRKLRELNLSYSNISPTNLIHFLNCARKLHALNLSWCSTLIKPLNIKKNHLRNLRTLNLLGSQISLDNLHALLASAQHLRTLSLGFCENIRSPLGIDWACFRWLNSLDISKLDLSPEDLNACFAATPKLHTLVLCGSTSLGDKVELEGIHLPHLEILNLANSSISFHNLNVFLAASSKLHTLNIRGCHNLDECFKFEPLSLDTLRFLDLSSTDLVIEDLSEFLLAAPKLHTLMLSACTWLDDELEWEAGSLPYLRTLDVKGSNISEHNINIILAAAPHLDQASKNNLRLLLKQQEENTPSTPLPTPEQFVPTNPTHDSKQQQDFKPTAPDEVFEFKGTNQTKNQGMIIEKLSQYLTQKKQHLAVIPKIQDGMCNALSHYFLDLEQASWDEFVNLAQEWNGGEEISGALSSHFESLYTYVETYQMDQQPSKYYLGDELKAYLDTKSPCILVNPWHAIALKPTPQGTWQVYDPNYVTGWQEISQNELLETLHTAIGSIVSMEGDRATHALGIHHPDEFMEHGGLLALCGCANPEAMLAELPQNYTYSEAALDGMLLRSMSGEPAWMIAMASPNPAIRALGATLKLQFEAMHGNASERLIKSMDALTPMQQGECITQLEQQAQPVARDTSLVEAIRSSESKHRYTKALKTWDKTAEYTPNITSYAHDCLKKIYSKRLIELSSTKHLDTLRLHLEQQALSTSRPVFYIDKPDDLICSAPWMKKNADGTGELCKGPGGPLYDFLQANQDKAPLILVNYEHFDADDMVRFNGFLDKEPHADGTALPKDTMIIGLMNKNKPGCYQGSDFYSRFNRTEQCPLTPEHLDEVAPSRTVVLDVATVADGERAIINLYHAPDWEERLLGRWVLDGDTLIFHEGALIQAMQTGQPIEIRQGMWGDPVFERFWQQILSGNIRHAGRQVHIPDHVHIIRPETEDYTWDKRDTILEINDDVVHPGARVLNPSSLGDFFGRYEVQGDKLIKQPGWIEACSSDPSEPSAHGASVLHVTVTRTLTDDAWAMLLDACTERGVPLSLHVAPGVVLPEAFGYSSITRGEPRKLQLPVTGDACLASTDIDTTVAMLIQDTEQAYHVIDISECTSADLLVRLDGKLNQESLKFEFSQSERAVLTGLAHNQNIILKGHFSPELLDALAPVLLERQQTPGAGQLLLVVDDATDAAAVSPMVATYTHAVRPKDKLACLDLNQATRDALTPYLEKEPLCQLQARCMYLKSHPTATNTQDAWLGMMHLSGHTHAETDRLNREQTEDESAAFITARKNDINAVLACSPYVFLTGLSGVGKSTFIETELCDSHSDTLYLTEHRIQAWASDTSSKRKILFLDEANLSTRQWSEFEGLFNTPPSMLIDGVVHRLDEHHKVVFAGNPVSYGDERTLAPFFRRHGNAVLFNPLPPAVIYEKILKPVLLEESVTDRILDVYDFICSCSETDVLISPRELQMMALLTHTRAQNYPEQSLDDIVEHFTYTLAKNLVPQKNRAQFDERFKPKNSLVMLPKVTHASREFFTTPSRHALIQQLHDLMDLRAWRQSSGSSLNTQQKSGGLGGIIIEGAPGIGKSELVIHELISRGYTEEHDFTNPSTAEDPFYRMPVSMPLQEKEALLMKAFDEGAVVMIDEMNSSPMMERLLNDLLMGKNPRAIEGRVAKPGFMVIGTQNPVSMAGRRVASTALQRRMMTTELPEYHPDEIKTILLAKGVPNQEAESMVEAYESNRAYAIKNNLSPVPNFRHVIDLAEHYLKSKAEQRLTPLQQLDRAIQRTYSGEEYDELREKATRAYHVLEALMVHCGEHNPVERDQINAYVRALVVAIDNPTVDHVQALEALSLEALHQSSSPYWQAAGIALMILSAAMFTAGIVITVATVGLATPVGVGLAVAGASLFAISAGSVHHEHKQDQHRMNSKEDLRLFAQTVKTQVKKEDTTPEVKPPPGTSQ